MTGTYETGSGARPETGGWLSALLAVLARALAAIGLRATERPGGPKAGGECIGLPPSRAAKNPLCPVSGVRVARKLTRRPGQPGTASPILTPPARSGRSGNTTTATPLSFDVVRAYCEDKIRLLAERKGVTLVTRGLCDDAWFARVRAAGGAVTIKNPVLQLAIEVEVDAAIERRDRETRALHRGPWNAVDGLPHEPTGPPFRCWEAA